MKGYSRLEKGGLRSEDEATPLGETRSWRPKERNWQPSLPWKEAAPESSRSYGNSQSSSYGRHQSYGNMDGRYDSGYSSYNSSNYSNGHRSYGYGSYNSQNYGDNEDWRHRGYGRWGMR